MEQSIIQTFLKLPGIVGLGLMDGHSRPYFCGIDQLLNFQQKEALTQGIQQVISTIPAGFEAFEFRFAERDVHIYKLSGGVILLVVTDQALPDAAYRQAIEELKCLLAVDPHGAVSTFRLLVEQVSASQQPYWARSAPAAATTAGAAEEGEPCWREVIAALNALSDATAPYLGKIVVANTWRAARADGDWLPWLIVGRDGHVSLSANAKTKEDEQLSPDSQALLYQWVESFTQRCARILRDYPDRMLKQALSDRQRALLGITRL